MPQFRPVYHMPENILVVEYEPRYTERVRLALTGQPFQPLFAKDGEEALRALQTQRPNLIVISSVLPRISTPDLIRAIRNEKTLERVPILLTVAGYSGQTPRIDAQRMGASDILPKPYSESQFLDKVQQMLTPAGIGTPHIVRATAPAATGNVTSDQLFGDITDEKPAAAAPPPPAAPKTKATSDVDKMLADTLAGVLPHRKKDGAPRTSPGNELKPKTHGGTTSIDKIVQDTLSGLEKSARGRVPSTPPATPPPGAPKIEPAATAPPPPPTAAAPAYEEKMPASQPVIPPAPPAPAAPRDEPLVEEEEPTDGIRFGQYVLLEKIATGGMAEVWKARMRGVEGFQKIVAIKKILPHLSDNKDFIDMFVDEAKLAAQLNHTNIIHIYDLGRLQGSYYIAMEYVEGFDLKNILSRAREHELPMTVETALFVASKVATALDYAHRKRDFQNNEIGLVHRDVSPQNVLISLEGDIKLCDFGIAKAASKASHTQAGALKGKIQYMAPEQAWGKPLDRRTDVFALGAVLFEMLTGRRLFAGDSEISILDQVREARVMPPSELNDEVPPEVDAIVLKALQKEPENRYQTAGEMAREIDQILYTYRPTPTAADLAIFMHRLSEPVPVHASGPAAVEEEISQPEPPPPAPPQPPPPPRIAPAVVTGAREPAPFEAPAPFAVPDRPRRSLVGPIAVVVVILLAAVGGFLYVRQRGDTGTPAAAAPTTTSPAAAAVPTQTVAEGTVAPSTVTDTASTLAPVTTSATTTTPLIDQAQVDEEVRKRLEAERLRLQQQTRATQTAAAAPAPVTATRAPAPAAPQTVTQAPPPQVAETRPAPPVEPPPQPVTETRAAPAPAQPAAEAPRTREGDLVPTGTAGLVPARMTRQVLPVYPPIARNQRMQGRVIIAALISETGQVMETRIVSGVRGGGLNDAAAAAVRRSSFAAGMKDGVRVKSWTTVQVDFKL